MTGAPRARCLLDRLACVHLMNGNIPILPFQYLSTPSIYLLTFRGDHKYWSALPRLIPTLCRNWPLTKEINLEKNFALLDLAVVFLDDSLDSAVMTIEPLGENFHGTTIQLSIAIHSALGRICHYRPFLCSGKIGIIPFKCGKHQLRKYFFYWHPLQISAVAISVWLFPKSTNNCHNFWWQGINMWCNNVYILEF